MVFSCKDRAEVSGSNLDLRDLRLDTNLFPEALIKLADKNGNRIGGNLQGELNRLPVVLEKALRLGWIVFRIHGIVAVPG